LHGTFTSGFENVRVSFVCSPGGLLVSVFAYITCTVWGAKSRFDVGWLLRSVEFSRINSTKSPASHAGNVS